MVVSTTTTNLAAPTTQPDVRPLPYLVPRSVIQKARHFSESYWSLGSDSIVYKILDALCGDAGAGNNKKALFISRLQHSLDSTYFQDLDSFYSGVLNFPRQLSESYTYNAQSNALTQAQWIEVLQKDARYRSRCLDLMSALAHGGSPFGIRQAVKSVLGVDSDIFEVWKYMDSTNYRSGLYANTSGLASTPNVATFNFTTGFSVSAKIRMPLFATGVYQVIVGKWTNTGAASWALRLTNTGFLDLVTTTGGTTASAVGTDSTIALPTTLQGVDVWVRASFNPNNGANRVASFYYSTDGATWTQLGTTVTAATTTIATTTAPVSVGNSGDANQSLSGWVYQVNLYSDLAWTTLVDGPSFLQSAGTTAFTDGQGFVWTITAPATTLPNFAVGRTGSNLRTEVLITPHRTFTRQEQRNLQQVLDRIKPREVVLTLGTGLQVNTQLPINHVGADGSYFETNILVTGASGITNAAKSNYYSQITAPAPPADSTLYYINDGVQTGAQTLAFMRGQESYENYNFSPVNISTIDSIEYDQASDPNNSATRTVVGKQLVQNAFNTRFGPWTNFDLADSPDNFPGGKYGLHPATAPALNQDGSTYQFRWASQAAYVTAQTAIIVAAGGEATATQYHVLLAQASIDTTISDPFNCLSDNVGTSVMSSWYESR